MRKSPRGAAASGSRQRRTEWFELTEEEKLYHLRQLERPNRSTEAFCDWLDREGLLGAGWRGRLIDLGAGAGANAGYLALRYPAAEVLGIELNGELAALGRGPLARLGAGNARLEQGDLYSPGPEHRGRYRGALSFQTLSWLPGSEEPLRAMAALEPEWLALSSLFFDGEVEYRIELRHHGRPKGGKPYEDSFCNVYSLPRTRALLARLGYTDFRCAPFEIDVDLPKPDGGRLGTYTLPLADGRRLQLSGAMMLPWYFLAAVKP